MRAPKILIVDDDQESRNLLCEVLQANGYAVEAVADGVAAREELRRDEGYVVVIADLRIPRETGLELLRNLRQEKSKQAIMGSISCLRWNRSLRLTFLTRWHRT